MLDMLLSAPLFLFGFIFVISITVVFHELGHFWVARACGAKVDVFSLGIGPKLFSVKDRKGTEWRLSALPFGGYVKFSGDANMSSFPSAEHIEKVKKKAQEEGREGELKNYFYFLPLWKRSLIVLAGPVANFILSILIFTIFSFSFGKVEIKPLVGEVIKGGAAEKAGLKENDYILEINNKKIRSFFDIQSAVVLASGNHLDFKVDRKNTILHLTLIPEKVDVEDNIGGKAKMGQIGIRSSENAEIIRKKYSPVEALGEGIKKTGFFIRMPGVYLARIFSGRENADQFGGPIRIALFAGVTAVKSVEKPENALDISFQERILNLIIQLFYLIAVISVGLGLVNLFPLPVLDGGHLLFYGIEAIRGKPLSKKTMELSFKAGFILIILLFIFVTRNDLIYLGKLYS